MKGFTLAPGHRNEKSSSLKGFTLAPGHRNRRSSSLRGFTLAPGHRNAVVFVGWTGHVVTGVLDTWQY